MMTTLECTGFPRYRHPRLAAVAMLARLKAFLRRLSREHRARAGARRLQSMSDWQLKDIGVHRSEIWYLVHGVPASSVRSHHAED